MGKTGTNGLCHCYNPFFLKKTTKYKNQGVLFLPMHKKRVIIVGAAGRDYHNFLVYYKDNPAYEVVAFTQAQIPGIEKRSFPKQLAGKYYHNNIPFFPEEKLAELIKKYKVDEVVLAYSDLPYDAVMHKASLALACGANFTLLGTNATMIKTKMPVISVCAVRTGCGKSQTSREVCRILQKKGYHPAVARHPMPYGDLVKKRVEYYSKPSDLVKYNTTIEEREEYEKYVNEGLSIYAGVDYGAILKEAEKRHDFLLWDGGNNDFSFYKPDLQIVVADAHRPGHEVAYYPGETNFLMADVIVINKVSAALEHNIEQIEQNAKKYNPRATIIRAVSEIHVNNPSKLKGKRAIVVGDGPTITHGGMKFSAGTVAAQRYGIKIVDAKPYAVRSIKATYQKYPHIQKELPAMGYDKDQIKDLQETINNADCDIILNASPTRLNRLIKTKKPIHTVSYKLGAASVRQLAAIINKKFPNKR